ncbi:MAG TPA: hypothetical protein VHG70_14940 [Nocardioidaceae bacterium]|jgi:hypothetical protein|nr:hypothetical protein [Nocardioidaceae bacterium]
MTMQEISPAPDLESGCETHEVLRSAALGPHELIGEMLDAAATHRASGTDPRRARQLADTFMATICRHLAAVDDAVLPVARRRLDGGRQLVTAYVLHSRELERTLRTLKARCYGDAHASRLTCSELWQRLRLLLAEHEVQENAMVDRLTDTLDGAELTALAELLQRIEGRSPTRPHPYSPHTGLAGRVSHRVWSVFDGFWDNAEGRVIPHQPPPRHPRSDSLLTRYMLGTPRFDDSHRSDRRAS